MSKTGIAPIPYEDISTNMNKGLERTYVHNTAIAPTLTYLRYRHFECEVIFPPI
jgi:hypothetical protein